MTSSATMAFIPTELLALLPPFLDTTAGDGFEARVALLEAEDDDEISIPRFTDDDDDDDAL